MFYFVPAWYQHSQKWGKLEQPHLEFDDTVHHIRMFQQANEPLCVVVTNYFPQLRHFLHRQEILDVPVWSVFDEIQGVQDLPIQRVIQLEDFEWGMAIEWVYTPFLIKVRAQQRTLAHIILNESGKIDTVEYFAPWHHRDVFDDRGFLSSRIHYNAEGTALYQEYFNGIGEWCVRVHLLAERHEVEINPREQGRFSQRVYASLDDLIEEMVQTKSKEWSPVDDGVIVSAHPHHTELYVKAFRHLKTGLTFFLERYPIDQALADSSLTQARLLVTDTPAKQAQLQALWPHLSERIVHLTPYDTRLRLGMSQRLKQLEIGLVVDTLSEQDRVQLFEIVGEMMAKQATLDVVVLTRQMEQVRVYQEALHAILDCFPVEVRETEESNVLDPKAKQEPWYTKRVTVIGIKEEQDVIMAFETVRMIVDVQEQADMFIQIAGISAGIPQINRHSSQYVTHQQNGYIIEQIDDLPVALNYYAIGLHHWNEALVYAVERLLHYTGDHIVAEWKTKLGWSI